MLAVLLLAASASADESAPLVRCVERSDHACVAALLSHAPGSPSPEFLAAAARGYILLGDRTHAVQAIVEAVAQRPHDFELLMSQGWVYQRSGDQVSAIRSFLLASQVDSTAPSVFYELGMSFFLLHEFDRAATHFRHAIDLHMKDGRADFMLGVLAVLQDALPDAKEHFERALAREPQNAHYLLHYGVLLSRLNDNDAALAQMRKAEQLDPANPLTHFNLGRLYRELGQLDDARHELQEAIRLRPDFSSAHYVLAGVYRRQGRPRDTATELAQFKKFKPKDDDGDPIDASLTQQ